MKTQRTLFIALVIGLLTAGITVDTYAQRGNRPMQRGPMMGAQGMGPGAGLFTQFDLTDEQQQKIKDIMLETHQQIMPLRNQVREAAAHLRTLTSGKADMSAVNQQIDQISQLRTQIMKKRMATHQDIRNLLTEEQRAWFDARPLRMGQGGRGGFNRGGMMPRQGPAGKRGMGSRGVCPWLNN